MNLDTRRDHDKGGTLIPSIDFDRPCGADTTDAVDAVYTRMVEGSLFIVEVWYHDTPCLMASKEALT